MLSVAPTVVPSCYVLVLINMYVPPAVCNRNICGRSVVCRAGESVRYHSADLKSSDPEPEKTPDAVLRPKHRCGTPTGHWLVPVTDHCNQAVMIKVPTQRPFCQCTMADGNIWHGQTTSLTTVLDLRFGHKDPLVKTCIENSNVVTNLQGTGMEVFCYALATARAHCYYTYCDFTSVNLTASATF